MRVFACHPNILVTGGKENELKLWDATNPKAPLFEAENVASRFSVLYIYCLNALKVPDNYLDIRMPIWITDIQFLSDNHNVIVTGTSYHQIRLYDIRAQRRPVKEIEVGKNAIRSITVTPDHK